MPGMRSGSGSQQQQQQASSGISSPGRSVRISSNGYHRPTVSGKPAPPGEKKLLSRNAWLDFISTDELAPHTVETNVNRVGQVQAWSPNKGAQGAEGRYSTLSDELVKRSTVVSAVSNLATAYNLTIIGVVHVLLRDQYCGVDECAREVAVVSTSCLVGAIVGQLVMGYVGDCIGRPRALQITILLTIVGALLSAVAMPITEDPKTVFYLVSGARLLLGVGVGGVYPLAATVAAESTSNAKLRGQVVSFVFSMQGIGTLLSPVVVYGLDQVFPSIHDAGAPHHYGWTWRIALALGAVPSMLLVPFKVPHAHAPNTQPGPLASQQGTPRQPPSAGGLQAGAGAGRHHHTELFPAQGPAHEGGQLKAKLCSRSNLRKLMGTAGCWFLFDFTFYGNVLFQSTVLHQVFGNSTSRLSQAAAHLDGPTLAHNTLAQIMIIDLLALPGFFVALALMDVLGRRKIQMFGFLMMALSFLTIGLCFEQLKEYPAMLLIVYSLSFFFSNFGPNSTTFILPSEMFPFAVRTTMNGFSAAAGKAGATLGSALFHPLARAHGVANVMVICAGFSLVGLVMTYCFIEDMRGRKLDGSSITGGTGRELRDSTADPPSVLRGQPSALRTRLLS